MIDLIQTAYLAPPALEDELRKELVDVTHQFGRLMVAKGPRQRVFWTQNVWLNPVFVEIESIGDAAKKLRAIQRNWWPYNFAHHRRIELIQSKLPHLAPKPIEFLAKVPSSPMGSYTLVAENTLLFASECESATPNGEWNFTEDKINPPSRAYLKLWEAFTRLGIKPGPTDTCLDLGASPGGWTWVLAKLAKKVVAFDRSELDPKVSALPNVTFVAQDAFKVNLADYPDASWIFSDVICYPEKLYEYLSKLLNDFPNKKYVFTIKFQGHNHLEITRKFADLPGTLLHLYANKHELTWTNAVDR